TPPPRPAPVVTILRAWSGDRALSLDGPTRLSVNDIAIADVALHLAKRRGRNPSIGVPVLDEVEPVDAEADTVLVDVGELGSARLRIVTTEGDGRAITAEPGSTKS
ncbi:MAG: hypothetical protein ACHREM_23365, partial [Polyangiales bacterium]